MQRYDETSKTKVMNKQSFTTWLLDGNLQSLRGSSVDMLINTMFQKFVDPNQNFTLYGQNN